jgi:hypothetical protein
MGRKSASGSRIRDEHNPDHILLELGNLFFGLKILKFFDADPGSGMETVLIRDPGSGMKKKSDPGSGINIPDPQHCSGRSILSSVRLGKCGRDLRIPTELTKGPPELVQHFCL